MDGRDKRLSVAQFVHGRSIDTIFANNTVRQRAYALFIEGSCTITSTSHEHIVGKVVGRTGIYLVSVGLSPRDNMLQVSCTCPSDYIPCKHVGAFLYEIQASVKVEAPPPERWTPGAIIRSDTHHAERAGGVNRLTDGVGFFRSMLPSVPATPVPRSAATRFRPAFKLVPAQATEPGRKAFFEMTPVLVYLRRDGADGRIETYSPSKSRTIADGATEGLLSIMAARGGRGLSALRLLAVWRDESETGGLDIPVELYHDRPTRDRELPVIPRRIAKIDIHWQSNVSYEGYLVHTPVLDLTDSERYTETIVEPYRQCEADERGLIVPIAASGSLWYLFDRDVDADRPADGRRTIAALADLFRLPVRLHAHETASLVDLAHRYVSHFVHVDQAPEHMTLTELTPVPVVALGTWFDGLCEIRVSFRYNNTVLEYEDDRKQISTGATGTTNGETVEVIVRSDKAEAYFLRTLADLIQPLQRGNGFGDSSVRAYPMRSRLHLSADRWHIVHKIGSALLDAGFEIQVEDEPVTRTNRTPRYRVVSSGESWLAIEPGLDWDGTFFPVEQVVAPGIVRVGNRIVLLPESARNPKALEKRTIGRRDLVALNEIAGDLYNPEHTALTDYRELSARMAGFQSLQPVDPPAAFGGRLRSYQQSGLAWLWFLHRYGLGGILADDMGLGKTVQALALLFLAREKGEMSRALVVCPVSTMGNWHAETCRFTPDFRGIIHSGANRARDAVQLAEYDLIFVSYDTILRDLEIFEKLDLDYLILDEAQTVKNPRAKRRGAIASIKAPHRLALTGTPVENSTLELWSIVDLVMPGVLGNRTQFMRRFGGSIMDRDDRSALELLHTTVRPLVLRRTKREVAPDLPAREEQITYVELGSRQAAVYESLRNRLEAEVNDSIEKTGMARSGMKILEAMLRLRQAAILPSLVDPAFDTIAAAKLDLLDDLVSEVASENNKALVFSQFTSVLDEIDRRLHSRGISTMRIQGNTPQQERTHRVAEFQDTEGFACFLISLKAGGLGINLTAADYVFLVDPWWNPAVEAQAIDRAHRIGRDRPVFAYRIVARGTIEEKILRLQERKRDLADALIREESGALRSLTAEDVKALFG